MSQNPLKPDIVPLERPERKNWDEQFHKDVEQAFIGPNYFSNPYSQVTYRLRCTATGLFEVSYQKRGGPKFWRLLLTLDANADIAGGEDVLRVEDFAENEAAGR